MHRPRICPRRDFIADARQFAVRVAGFFVVVDMLDRKRLAAAPFVNRDANAKRAQHTHSDVKPSHINNVGSTAALFNTVIPTEGAPC